MKNYCLLLVVLCSVFAIQSVNCGKLRSKAKENFTPTTYFMEITEFDGVKARDVGVGADGTIWYIGDGDKDSNGDYPVYRILPGSSASEKMSGSAQYISVDPNGIAWTVNKAGNIYKYVGPNWTKIEGTGYDISCSSDGNVYHIGTNSNLYWRSRDGKSWSKLNGAGVRIAGGPSQSVWHTNSAGNIYRRYPAGDWEQVTGSATDIAIGANGLVWILTSAAVPNQFSVYDEHLQNWVDAPVSAYLAKSGQSFSNSKTTRIAVAPNGDLLGVREDSSMFRLRFNWTY